MGDISRYFNRREFACKCGCGLDTVDAALLRICDLVREHEGGPVTVNSAHRCAAHNARVGGGVASQHLQGRAADLRVRDPLAVRTWLQGRFPNALGIGVYDSFIHIDSRTIAPARWDLRGGDK